MTSLDPPLTAVRTAYPAEPLPPFRDPPIKLPSSGQRPIRIELILPQPASETPDVS